MDDLFRLIVPIEKHPFPMSHKNRILMFGSCFTENISSKLRASLFDIIWNPTGILYNPFSIASAIERVISGKLYEIDELFYHDGLWHSFDHHSRFSRPTQETTLEAINSCLLDAFAYITTADFLLLTPGSSFTYKNRETGAIVANCHRLPHNQFVRECTSAEQIYQNWRSLLQKIYLINPDIHIILTVSPVRHYPAQPRDNQISKANCISAFYTLENEFPGTYYFPSYEIMMDELRDYRFYEKDMLHPSTVAIDYIWKRFCEACISERSNQFIKDFSSILSARNHTISPDTPVEQSNRFASSIVQKIEDLRLRYPDISLQSELTFFNSLIK